MSAAELDELMPMLERLRAMGAQHVELRASGDVAVVFGAPVLPAAAMLPGAREPGIDVEADDADSLFDSADG